MSAPVQAHLPDGESHRLPVFLPRDVPTPSPPHRLDHLGKLLQPELRPRIEALVRGEPVAPVVATIDPTGRCGFRCGHCVMGGYAGLPGGDIPAERFLRLPGELARAGVMAVELVESEPTLHPALDDFLKACQRHGLRVGIITNGIRLAEHADVIADTCSWLRVSLDAATSRTHALVHGIPENGLFSRVVGAIEGVTARDGADVGVSFLLLDENIDEIPAAAELARPTGARYFEIKPCCNPHSKLLCDYSLDAMRIRDRVSAARALADGQFQVISPASLDLALAGQQQPPKTVNTCPICQLRVVISPWGFSPCTYLRGEPAWPLGGLDQPIDEALAGNRRRSDALQSINPSRDCGFFCARVKASVFLQHLTEAYQGGVDMLSLFADSGSTCFDPFI